jgi:hypothetical protein
MASRKEYFPSFPIITPMLEQYHEFYNSGVNRGPQKCCFSNEMRGITFLIMSSIQRKHLNGLFGKLSQIFREDDSYFIIIFM